MADEVEVVGKYQLEYEAELARIALEAEGIQAVILSDLAGSMLPAMRSHFPLRLAVNRNDAELARRILGGEEEREEG
jgi:hypothetical protein